MRQCDEATLMVNCCLCGLESFYKCFVFFPTLSVYNIQTQLMNFDENLSIPLNEF